MNIATYIEKNNKSHLIFDFDATIGMLILPWDRCLDPIKKELMAIDKNIYETCKKENIVISEMQNRYVMKYGQTLQKLFNDNTQQFETNFLRDVKMNTELVQYIQNTEEKNIYLWTSNARKTIEKILKQHNIYNKFQKIITREDVLLLKPYADGFAHIEYEGIDKKQFLFIGDSKADKGAAHVLGIDFFLIDYFKHGIITS